MTQGYIIQFYHPIEADLPEDIREDWMQWHHECTELHGLTRSGWL